MLEIGFIAASVLITAGGACASRLSYLHNRKLHVRFGNEGEGIAYDLLDAIMASDRLDDITIGTGRLKSSAQIDHLLRGKKRLVLVETKNWGGKFSGGEDDEHWLVVHRDNVPRYRRNPLRQARRQSDVLRSLFPGVEVEPRVLMVGSGFHETAFPSGVYRKSQTTELRKLIEEPGTDEQVRQTDAIWDRLVEHAYSPGHEKRKARYVAAVEDKFIEKPWMTWLFASFSFSVLMFAMGYLHHAMIVRDVHPFS